jgi:hypothetical protein
VNLVVSLVIRWRILPAISEGIELVVHRLEFLLIVFGLIGARLVLRSGYRSG